MLFKSKILYILIEQVTFLYNSSDISLQACWIVMNFELGVTSSIISGLLVWGELLDLIRRMRSIFIVEGTW